MIKVSDYLAKRLYELGCRHVFMVTGGGAMHLNDSFARTQPFEVVYNHHEQACAIGAEGLYRASGGVGIVNVTTGPGGLNTLTGLMGQWTDSIPAIYVSGQVKYETTVMSCPELGLRQLGDQEVDIVPIVKPLTKYAVSLLDPKQVRYEIEKAFHVATTGRAGPVWLDIPMNVQGAQVEEKDLEGFQPGLSHPQKIDTELIWSELKNAERPVLVAGHGIRLSGTVGPFLELLQNLQIPTLTTFNGFDLIPDDNPSYCGRIGTLGTRGGNFTLQNADLVLLLGTRNNVRQVSYNWPNFAHRAFTIAVDIDPRELNKPTFKAAANICADLADLIPQLLIESKVNVWPREQHRKWLAWAKTRTVKYPIVSQVHYLQKNRINPYAFFDRFTNLLPENCTVVAGNGSACVCLFQAGKIKPGQRMFWNSGCASMGFDLPAAVGASVGTKGPVWCLAGDGSLQMNLQEIATVAHQRLPVKLVYLNNGGYASIRQTQTNFFGAQYGCGVTSGLGFPNMEKLASAYGLPYLLSQSIDDVEKDFQTINNTLGPIIWEIELQLDYSFEPKLSSEKLPDGRMISKPLEDLFPFLPRDEFESNMIKPGESL